MFESSTDLFYIVASVSLAVLTVFVCVALYHLIAILSRAHRLVDAVEGFLEKAGKMTAYLGMIGSAAQMIKKRFTSDEDEEDEEVEEPKITKTRSKKVKK